MAKTKHKNKKRKKSSEDNVPESKLARNGGSSPVSPESPESPVLISDQIHIANSVLYDVNNGLMENSVLDISVFTDSAIGGNAVMDSCHQVSHIDTSAPTAPVCSTPSVMTMSVSSPSNADIVTYLKRIESRIVHVEQKLDKLDLLEQKVSSLDVEMKKVWNYVHDNIKTSDTKINKVSDIVDSLSIALGQANERIQFLEREKQSLDDKLSYLSSQSMRNNLVFGNIPEVPDEKPEVTERKVRSFMVEKLQLAQSFVDKLSIDRAHRMGDRRTPPRRSFSNVVSGAASESDVKPRNVVVKFTAFKDRETVRRSRTALKGTDFYIHEQFPKEIADRRRALIPQLKAAVKDKKKAWISYDTLYIDGKPQLYNTTQGDVTAVNIH